MKPLDHSECEPESCLHRRESDYYDQKRRRRLPEDKGMVEPLEAVLNSAEAKGYAPPRTNEEGVRFYGAAEQRRLRVESLEAALLEARADMVEHGDPMPLQDLRNVVGDALRLAELKNRQYGDAWRKNGYMGNLARIGSKADRLRAMLWRDPDGNGYPLPANYNRDGETIVDTLLDLINLAGFMAINWTEENRWGNR